MDSQYECRLPKSPPISPNSKRKIPTTPTKSKRQLFPEKSPKKYSCRFIPSRSGTDLQNGFYSPTKSPSKHLQKNEDAYERLLRTELLSSPDGGLFRYQVGTPNTTSRFIPIPPSTAICSLNTKRKIQTSPFKILDAPSLADDFYLNLVDWGSTNILAVGLADCIYLWNASTAKVTKLCVISPDDHQVTSVAWMDTGTHVAFGVSSGHVQLWDVQGCKLVRDFKGHSARVGCLSWNSNTLTSGSRDHTILNRDIRSPQPYISKRTAHRQEVCGLKWSPDGRELASGGNDNKLFVWHPAHNTPVLRFTEHTAAVKAIAWSPHQHGLLASGGGTADRCLRFWNTISGTPLSYLDTDSQVCNLAWSQNVNEIVSTHGYSLNQVVVWKYPQMTPLATLTGHTYRVLYLSCSPDGQTIVTGAGDETLRFWNVFPPAKSKGSSSSNITMDIR